MVFEKKYSMTQRVIIGLISGVILGLITYSLPVGTLRDTILKDGIFLLIGQLFLRSIMMLVVPLVFVSLINGVAGMGDIQKVGRVGIRTMGFYMITTAIAVVISLSLGYFLKPGIGLDMQAIEVVDTAINEQVPLVEILYSIIPRNPIQAMAEGDMLAIIFFAVIVGIGLSLMGDQARRLNQLFKDINELMMKLVMTIMKFAPYGVAALIARTMADVGLKALLPLAKYVLVIYIGLFIHMFIVYSSLLKSGTDFSIRKFYKKFFPVMSLAFSTATSTATIPLSMETLEKDMGISREISSFTIPLGATVNMDGTAIMQGVAVFFIAQAYNIPVTFNMMVTVVVTATLASIGTAGVPGAGPIMLSMILQSVGLPTEGIGLIMGVDRLVDMGRTTTNITGDAVCTAVIATKEKAIDRDVMIDR